MWSPSAASVILLSIALTGCNGNKTPPPAGTATATAASAAPTGSAKAAASVSGTASAAPSGSAALLPEREIAGASQILVAYKGAEMAPKTVTRSKEDAKKRAEEALSKIKKDKMPFEEAVKTYSDDAASAKIGGALGNFEKNAMPEAFSKATFAMKVGDISDVVETQRGFHIIKRTR
jgi:hypothetical protein